MHLFIDNISTFLLQLILLHFSLTLLTVDFFLLLCFLGWPFFQNNIIEYVILILSLMVNNYAWSYCLLDLVGLGSKTQQPGYHDSSLLLQQLHALKRQVR